MKYIISILLIFSVTAGACELTLPHELIILGEDSGSVAQGPTNCDQNITKATGQILSELEGRALATHVTEMLAQRGFLNVRISPQTVMVTQMKSLIRDQIDLPPGVQVKTTRGLNTQGFIALAPGDKLEVACSNCLFGQQQPINIIRVGFDGMNHSYMISADFKKMVRAYKLIQSIPAFSDISASEVLREVYVETIPHTELVNDLETLKFYKTNKPIKAGEMLKQADLNAMNLVRAGLKTEVVLENSVVRIKTHGISKSNGALGEIVEVYHQQKNKKYQGKVIDNNKVLVEL